jgi:hypothetical protein
MIFHSRVNKYYLYSRKAKLSENIDGAIIYADRDRSTLWNPRDTGGHQVDINI